MDNKDISIADICQHPAETISEDETIENAVKFLEKKDRNGYIVMNKKEEIVGIISVQDIAAATIPQEFRQNIQMAKAMYKPGFFFETAKEIKKKKVKDIMRKNFITADLNTNIMAIVTDFLLNDLYIVPVIEKGKLYGVVSRSQIKKALLQAFNHNH